MTAADKKRLADQVAAWEREIARLSELVAHATGKPCAAAPMNLRPISTAPRDGTPVLLLGSVDGVSKPIYFVGRNRGDHFDWGFAAPVGYAGITDRWLVGWMPLPPAEQLKDGGRGGKERN